MFFMLPYCGPPPEPGTLLSDWNMDPALIGGTILITLLGLLSSTYAPSPARARKLIGLAVLGFVIAFISPLCALTVALFSARSLHHIILICWIAPALALFMREFVSSRLPGMVGLGGASLALWAWHLPAIYSAAWANHLIYWGMQAALLLAAVLMWFSVLGQRGMSNHLRGALVLTAFAGQMGLIGAILVFSEKGLYKEHILLADAFGLTAWGDQQLAGLVMWVPGMAPIALLAALILRRGWREVSAS